jgi:uncharacterized protein
MSESAEDTGRLSPVGGGERIEALDVVRGFALIGVFLMNVEWFSRPLESMGRGLPAGLTGADWLAAWLVYMLVQGKFWTLFSLLFGMGFAVMLTRAERAGRSFLRPYLRRIAALMAFGILHHVLLWGGDILLSYSLGALALLTVLYGRWPWILAGLAVLGVLGLPAKLHPVWAFAGSLAFLGLVAWYARGEGKLSLRSLRLPGFSVLFLALGSLALAFTAYLWIAPHAPREPRAPMSIVTLLLLAVGILSAKYRDPAEARPRRLGLALYFLPVLMMTLFGGLQYFAPEPPTAAAPPPSAAVAAPLRATPPPGAETRRTKAKAEAERTAEQRAEQTRQNAQYQEDVRAELHAITEGTYREFVRFRARKLLDHAPQEAGFALVLVGVFLLGSWFVRSGIMEHPERHLDLFRRLARLALPLGVGLGLLGGLIATSHLSGAEQDGYQLAFGLLMIGNLPACLGYLGLVVVALHSGTALARIRVLAPVGRMALTNYLTQSVVCSFYFFHYGLGHFGMGRARQVAFVAVVFTLQVAFSHWWLGRFRYGPMEWLWRAITYWRIPPMRLEPAQSPQPGGATAG